MSKTLTICKNTKVL